MTQADKIKQGRGWKVCCKATHLYFDTKQLGMVLTCPHGNQFLGVPQLRNLLAEAPECAQCKHYAKELIFYEGLVIELRKRLAEARKEALEQAAQAFPCEYAYCRTVFPDSVITCGNCTVAAAIRALAPEAADAPRGMMISDSRKQEKHEQLMATHPAPVWKCKAQPTADPPQDCDWPTCGCDPYADKVVEALQESGKLAAQATCPHNHPASGLTCGPECQPVSEADKVLKLLLERYPSGILWTEESENYLRALLEAAEHAALEKAGRACAENVKGCMSNASCHMIDIEAIRALQRSADKEAK
jgi:hypothetical protein